MTQINAELIYEKLKNLETGQVSIQTKLDKDFATKSELEVLEYRLGLVQYIVFGLIGLIITAVGGALISLVVK